MANYKLKALAVSGHGKKVHKIEDNAILTENDFAPGRAEQLVKLGFLIKLEEEVTVVKQEEKIELPTIKKATKKK